MVIGEITRILKGYYKTLRSSPIPSSKWAIKSYGTFRTPDGLIIGCEDEKLADKYRNDPTYKEIN